jgi:hypothetical protein
VAARRDRLRSATEALTGAPGSLTEGVERRAFPASAARGAVRAADRAACAAALLKVANGEPASLRQPSIPMRRRSSLGGAA